LHMKWGIHPETHKAGTVNLAIEDGGIPSRVILPIRQHIGAPSAPIVKKGDYVKKGQLIAQSDTQVSSPVHASISGIVAEVTVKPHPVYGECLAVVIESDGLDQWTEGILKERKWEAMDRNKIIEIIKASGVVGMGGAAFPTHVKLSPLKEIDTLIINAAECEPFLTVDHRIMLEYPERVTTGIKIMKKLLEVENVIVGIENNKMDAVDLMKHTLGDIARVIPIPTRYPQGAEKMIIHTLLQRDVAPGRLPMDVGVVVQNVSTVLAVCDAVRYEKPLIERVVTVSGDAVRIPKNLKLRIGVTFSEAIGLCGGFKQTPAKVIMGGPMMGIAQYTLDVPVIKGTSGILALSKKNVRQRVETACIRCGRCAERCPMGLNPSMLSILGEKELFDEAREEYHLFDCIECGCCSFSCPARRNIVHYIRYLKKLSTDNTAKKKEAK
jgi:electron transport complex protein RnfC